MKKFLQFLAKPFVGCKKWWSELADVSFLGVSYPVSSYPSYPTTFREPNNTMNAVLKIAVEVADNATSLARDLLEKWFEAEKARVIAKRGQEDYYKSLDGLESQYYEYKRRLGRIENP